MAQSPMNISNGWLNAAHQCVSPNFDQRPDNCPLDLLVIHNISLPPGQFGGPWISQLFCNQLDPDAHPYFREIHQLRVSSHLLIRRNGDVIQYVPFFKRAWHAGRSRFQGQENCNDNAIGIELEGSDNISYEDIQYQLLTEITTTLLSNYPLITPERITGHSDIAPTRKTDPGPAFDWPRYRNSLTNALR